MTGVQTCALPISDYNPGGVKGIGQKRALEIVQKYVYPVQIFTFVQKNFNFIFDWQEIFRQFHEYDATYIDEIEFKEVDEDKIKEILLSHSFSENRIDSGLKRLRHIADAKKQKGLSDFF